MTTMDRVWMWIFGLVMGPLVLCLIYLAAVVIPYTVVADAACKRAGYSRALVTFGLTRFCHRFINGTEEIVPYEVIEGGVK